MSRWKTCWSQCLDPDISLYSDLSYALRHSMDSSVAANYNFSRRTGLLIKTSSLKVQKGTAKEKRFSQFSTTKSFPFRLWCSLPIPLEFTQTFKHSLWNILDFFMLLNICVNASLDLFAFIVTFCFLYEPTLAIHNRQWILLNVTYCSSLQLTRWIWWKRVTACNKWFHWSLLW